MKRTTVDPLILKLIDNKNIKNILDLGAGECLDALGCAKFGKNVDAVDMVRPSHKILDELGVNFIKTTIEKWLPSPRKKYDLIIIRGVLHYLKSDFVFKKLLPGIEKILNDNGYLYILSASTPAGEDRYPHDVKDISKALCGLRVIREKLISREHNTWSLIYKKSKNPNK